MTVHLDASHRLATYGTLAPGRPNAHQLSALAGEWTTGTVRGRLIEEGWGAAMGYPALILDPAGGPVDVFLLTSEDLPAHWARLDAFEGPGYERAVVTVGVGSEVLEACVYVHVA